MTLEKIEPLVIGIVFVAVIVLKMIRDHTDLVDEDNMTFIIEIVLECGLLFSLAWHALVL